MRWKKRRIEFIKCIAVRRGDNFLRNCFVMILFTALKLPHRISKQISDIQRGVMGTRWLDIDNLHITTCYYGDVDFDIAETLDCELAKYPLSSFELQFEGAGHTGNSPPLTLWLGIKNNKFLHDLNRYCISAAKRAGIESEKTVYRPHVTLGYLSEEVKIERIIAFEKRTSRFNSAPFLVDEMALYSSHRRFSKSNIYRKEATYPMVGFKKNL
jgi:2'-5' RNA ligase